MEELSTLRKIGSHLQGHPDMRKVPGVDLSTGSLGTGFSAATGIAMACKLDKKENYVYTLLGDGELQEGQVWEAAMSAAHYKLDNLIAFVDNNGLQIDGNIDDVLSPNPIDAKFAAFGWHVLTIDGHDFQQIAAAVAAAKAEKRSSDNDCGQNSKKARAYLIWKTRLDGMAARLVKNRSLRLWPN